MVRHALWWLTETATVLLFAAIPTTGWAVVYVDVDNVTGRLDGKSWASAYNTVQEGIDVAHNAGGGDVWIAQGTYKPTSTSDRAVSFQLKPDVALYGGFSGRETRREQRDWARQTTILSGDIGVRGDNRDNSYHVVKGADNATIGGFTITAGNADGDAYDGNGGGMVNYDTSFRISARRGARRSGGGLGIVASSGFSPTVANCTFTANSAREGGALYNYDDASVTLTNCTFTANSADKGGAMVNRMASNCTVTDCTFSGNHARWRGGAVFNDYGSSPTFTNCTFAENSTSGNGGGMYTDDTSSQIGHTSPMVSNCTFAKNTAGCRGGGMANYNKCTPTVTGCTFAGNYAGEGGGAISNDYHVTVTVTNCSFAGNSAGEGAADTDTDQSSRVRSRPPSTENAAEAQGLRGPQRPPAFGGPQGQAGVGESGEERRGSPETVVHVRADNVAGPWDGRSWATACRTVQEGLDAASHVGGGEVWVAAGTYKPTSTSDRSVSFQLKSGITLYGGFAGTETAREQRDWAKHITILSGDIGVRDENNDNSYHVVKGADNAVMDGFTITEGNALPARRPGERRGMGPGRGLGIRPPGAPGRGNQHLTPQIIASGARSESCGGGMLNIRCAPRVVNCVFSENSAGKGGGMYNMCATGFGPGGAASDAPTLVNCTFTGNYAGGRGGGMSNDLSTHPTLINCTFINNSTGGKGGGMYNDFNCSPTLTNCIFAGNSAERGGGMANDGSSCPALTNCVFTRNHAKDLGGGLYNGTYRPGGVACSPTLTNCILWGNITPSGPTEISNWHEDAPTVTFCVIEGGYGGRGNINADPLFVDPENGDYRLRSGSPCVDAGNGSIAPATDKDGNPRNAPVDIGAYEWQGEK